MASSAERVGKQRFSHKVWFEADIPIIQMYSSDGVGSQLLRRYITSLRLEMDIK